MSTGHATSSSARCARSFVTPLSFLFVALLLSCTSATPPQLSPREVQEDFQTLWSFVNENYAYFDLADCDWKSVPTRYATEIDRVKTKRELVSFLERVVDELHDAHAQLTVNTPASPRLVPSGADLWAEWIGGRATIVEVRKGSDAERAGLRPRDEIVTFNGVPIADAVRDRIGFSTANPSRLTRDWSLRAVLAGRHAAARSLDLMRNNARTHFDLPASDQFTSHEAGPVSNSVIDDQIGYIRFNDSLGDSATIGAFDAALEALRKTRGLVVDLRDTPGGGNSTIARAVLGRFVDRDLPYQKHLLPSEERETGIRRAWLELVSPRGTFRYQNPVVVLVDHWTGSMGEGLAIGFDATHTATVVGTEMAGLRGATTHVTLPHSGFGVNIPTERLYHVDGTPRQSWRPPVYVDVATAVSADPILDAGVVTLEKRLRGDNR